MSEMIDSATQTYDDPDPDLGPVRASPRAQIDTSAPFGSVEEAVIRFGGRGFWAPPSSAESSEFDICQLEEQAAEMLKDLDSKQQETLDILKELELTKRLIEELKLKLNKESSEFVVTPPSHIDYSRIHPKSPDCSSLPPPSPAALVMSELKQAKLNLSQSTNDLEAIRASVECVNKKMDTKTGSLASSAKKIFIGNGSPLGISRELRELNLEAEQFMRTAEAAKAEVLRAMSEIEQTKTGLRMIEMRWVAAKKLEEAAKATEALALAEIKALSTTTPGRISLSFEEYSSLAERARKAEADDAAAQRGHRLTEMSLREFMRRVEGANRAHLTNPPRHEADARSKPVLRPSTSIGDILSRKLVLRDDLDVGRQEDRQRVSLNQMLHRHRAQSPPPRRSEKGNGGDSKGFFSKRKNLGFVHISLPVSKPSKNRIQALNLW